MDERRKLWFRRKRFGWGWYPITWQGWLVTLAFAGVIIFVAAVYSELVKFVANDPMGITKLTALLILIEAVLSGLLIYICYKTGESPKWQWKWRNEDAGESKP